MAEFANDIKTEEAFRAMLDGGIVLAWTALDATMNPTFKNHLIRTAIHHNGSRITKMD